MPRVRSYRKYSYTPVKNQSRNARYRNLHNSYYLNGKEYIIDPIKYLYFTYGVPYPIATELNLQKFVEPTRGGYDKEELDIKGEEIKTEMEIMKQEGLI